MTTETSERKTRKKWPTFSLIKLYSSHKGQLHLTGSRKQKLKTTKQEMCLEKIESNQAASVRIALAWSAICFLRCTICLSVSPPQPLPPPPPTPLLVSNTCKQYHYDWLQINIIIIQCLFRFVGFLQALRALLSALRLRVIIIINITQEKLLPATPPM